MKPYRLVILFLVLIAACTPGPKPIAKQQCEWPEILDNSECCKDLNENNVCDAEEFAEEIEKQKQEEYEEAARRARETAQKAGQFKKTVLDEVIEEAEKTTSYSFFYKGNKYVVFPRKIVVELVNEKNLGPKIIDGRRKTAIINTIHVFSGERRAEGLCVPPPEMVKAGMGTPCDEIIGEVFELRYDDYKIPLPMEWLWKVRHRNPYETLQAQHKNNKKTTLYKVRLGADSINLWVDDVTKLPISVEYFREGEQPEKHNYFDLQKI